MNTNSGKTTTTVSVREAVFFLTQMNTDTHGLSVRVEAVETVAGEVLAAYPSRMFAPVGRRQISTP